MRTLQKTPRTLRPNKFSDNRAKTRGHIGSLQANRLSKVETLKTDPLEFFRQILGVEPTDYEKELIELFQKNQFVAARWSRQSGKSFTTSGILLNYALVNPNSYIGVVGPVGAKQNLSSDALGILLGGCRLAPKLLCRKPRYHALMGALLRLSQTTRILSEGLRCTWSMLTNSTSFQTPKTSTTQLSSLWERLTGSSSAPAHHGTRIASFGGSATNRTLTISPGIT